MDWTTSVDTSQLFTSPFHPFAPRAMKVLVRRGPSESFVPEPPIVADRAHWVVPGVLFMGAHATTDTEAELCSVLRSSSNVCVVNLVEPWERKLPRYCELGSGQKLSGVRVMHVPFPVRRGCTPDDDHLVPFVDDLLERLLCNGETMFIFSSDGRSRAVALCAVLVGVMFSFSFDEALAYVRACVRVGDDILNSAQRDQVQRVLTAKRHEFCFHHNLTAATSSMARPGATVPLNVLGCPVHGQGLQTTFAAPVVYVSSEGVGNNSANTVTAHAHIDATPSTMLVSQLSSQTSTTSGHRHGDPTVNTKNGGTNALMASPSVCRTEGTDVSVMTDDDDDTDTDNNSSGTDG
eukprot:PhM_4_TR17750/c0_g1_i2/m.54907